MEGVQKTYQDLEIKSTKTIDCNNQSSKQKMDGCYTRLLRSALDISWKAHMSDEQLYGILTCQWHNYQEEYFEKHCFGNGIEQEFCVRCIDRMVREA